MKSETLHFHMRCIDCKRTTPDIQFLYKCIICQSFDNSKYCDFCLDSHIAQYH